MMHDLTPQALKAILHSKRANIYYLEKCRVMQKSGRVLYLTEEKKDKQYWNIPIANTTCLLLGTGTSITQAAMRMLASAGVLVGFCGGGATPLIAANEIEWLSPQSEYRPTEYVQGWMSWWFDDEQRLKVAKQFQQLRIEYLQRIWRSDKDLKAEGFHVDDADTERSHLIRLKTKTGIDNWNILCRWAFCLSLAESTLPRSDGVAREGAAIEMTWRTFGGDFSDVYLALLKHACHAQGLEINKQNLESLLWLHIHRGIGYLMGNKKKGIENMLLQAGLGDKFSG